MEFAESIVVTAPAATAAKWDPTPSLPSPACGGGLGWGLPRPLRFLAVGGFGLATDLAVFTLAAGFGLDPLLARLVSLGCATALTWRLNRAFTFARTGRHQGREALRYAAVTATAQGASYLIFAVLVLSVLRPWPQAAVLIGAAVGAVLSYNGHRLFAFAPGQVDA